MRTSMTQHYRTKALRRKPGLDASISHFYVPSMSEAQDRKIIPRNIQWLDGHSAVQIEWADGHVSEYASEYLRAICPCAECRGTHDNPPISPKPTSSKKLQMHSPKAANKARKRIMPLKAFPVGNYGIGFKWADGHKDGLYTFKLLREMCPVEGKEKLQQN